jgi:hypothetical protein
VEMSDDDEEEDDEHADSVGADDEDWDPSLATPAAGRRRPGRSISQIATVSLSLSSCTTDFWRVSVWQHAQQAPSHCDVQCFH